jgi:hypothetical protein
MAQQHTIGKVATTVATDGDGKTHVTYHQTQVVSFDADTVTLRSNGWGTATTKVRMNQASQQFSLGYSVFQKNFNWFVEVGGRAVPFVDGMSFPRS